MKIKAKRTMAEKSVWRMICAGGAVLALLLCAGCDDSIRQEVRQGALSVFESSLNAGYSQLGSNLNTVIQDLSISGGTASAATDTGGGG